MRAALAPEALGRRTVCEGSLAHYPAPIGHISFPCPACATQLAGSLARRTALASVTQFIGSGAIRFPKLSCICCWSFDSTEYLTDYIDSYHDGVFLWRQL